MNNIEPIVSVFMITYNHEKYISQALDSILMQNANFSYDIVIGEDKSTDSTREILLKYYEQYPDKIKLILHEQNVGITRNLIITMEACKGKFIALCDGDDYWTDSYRLQNQVDYMEVNPHLTMCFSNSIIVDEENNVINPSRVPTNMQKKINQKDILNGFSPPTNTLLLRNIYLQQILPLINNNIINCDYFISCLMANFGDIGYLDANVAAYRKHEGGAWSSASEFQRDISLYNLYDTLSKYVEEENKSFLKISALNIAQKLQKENMEETFLDNNYWTPQTAMLRSIRDLIQKISGNPSIALSIDDNPTLEQIVLKKWPNMVIQYAKYPEHDAQNMVNFRDSSFDIVFSHQVLEHIPKPWLAGKEIVRVLKPGGIGIHTSCAFNPRHGQPAFNDYYRFLPDGLAELFDGVKIILKDEWGNRNAILYNVGIDDGHGALGGRRFNQHIGEKSDGLYPWHTWIIFQKL
jgi:glycosyltransferase involved in cell wall biosynthesis